MNAVNSETLHGLECDVQMSTIVTERRNMRCGIMHGAFFHMATAFADPYAIIPLFLAGFTESRALIGFVVSLVEAVGVLPQIGIAGILRRRPNSAKLLMLVGIWPCCVVWGALAILSLSIPNPGGLMLGLFMVGVSLYALGGGVAVLPLRKVISETIAPEHRSSFFGWRLFTGGLLAVLAGLTVKGVLGSGTLVWPCNYGVLFLMSFVALGIAYTAMSYLRFPLVPPEQSSPSAPLFPELRLIWRQYPVLKRLIGVRLLSGGLVLALPFLTLYATRSRGSMP